MNRFLYALIYLPAYLMALLPFRILFIISDFIYYILYYIIRYRKKLVRKNLNNAFPEKTPSEILKIEKDFYRHFCDYFVETIKMLHISDSQMKEHLQFKDMEPLQRLIDKRQNVVVYLGHYGNWEWVTSIGLHLLTDERTIFAQIYRPLKNKAADLFFLNLRKRFHSIGFTKHSVYRDIIKLRQTNTNWVLGCMSDQKPSGNQIPHWMPFLNQDTPVLTGTEKIARHTGAAVCYLDITCLKRGYYQGNMLVVTENPTELSEFEITEKYIQLLEQTIQRNPSAYLWTHNRWKLRTNS